VLKEVPKVDVESWRDGKSDAGADYCCPAYQELELFFLAAAAAARGSLRCKSVG